MYIVRDKQEKSIIYIDHGESSSKVAPKDVYPEFDPKTMEVGWSRAAELPEYYKIDKNDKIVALSLSEKVREGIINLPPTQRMVRGKIVDKTLSQQVKEGLIELQPLEKIVGEQIVVKTLDEQVREGLIELAPSEKIDNDQIVLKTAEEELSEGTIIVDEPFQFVSDNFIGRRTVDELLDQGLLTTVAHCERALQMLDRLTEDRIAERYSKGRELDLIKEYIEWLGADKPKNDPGAQKYQNMQSFIKAAKKEYKPLRTQLNKILAGLQKPSKK